MSAARLQRLVEGGSANHTGAVPRALLVETVGVTVVAVVLVLLPWALQRRLIYLPSTGPVASVVDVLPGGRDVTLHTTDGLAQQERGPAVGCPPQTRAWRDAL